MRTLISICARGGSKGIPGKNIKAIAGKPLIAYTIDTANQLAQVCNADVTLSTDNEVIKEVAAKHGLITDYERPPEMATDEAGKLDVIKAVLLYEENKRNIQYDLQIDLDVTSPLRTVTDILEGVKILMNNDAALNLFSVNKAARNPYFNMVEEDGKGFYKLVKQGDFLTRQGSPRVFDLNASFYIFKRRFFEENAKTINDKSLIYVMPHICFDLDEPLDFEIMEYLISNSKLNFQL